MRPTPVTRRYAGELKKKPPADLLKKGKYEMNDPQEKLANQKTEIITQIAELSMILGMIPSDDTIKIHDP
jgi:hypothetical protein